MTSDEKEIAVGSGFLWRSDDRISLVTAGHNVTGMHPEAGQYLSSSELVPSGLVVEVASVGRRTGTTESVGWDRIQVPLVSGDGSPLWRQHPEGRKIDVASVDVSGLDLAWHVAVNDDLDEYVDFRLTAGQDAFVIGYPEGLTGGGSTPIWKKATVASEPAIATQKQAPVLIDTATRRGMSGSPVFVKETGLIIPTGLEDAQTPNGTVHPETIIGTGYRFLGCYTSRPLHDNTGTLAQLGTVFTEKQIADVVDRGVAPG